MVKSVVKPLEMGFLRERIVPKKSVFTRDFGVFCFGIPWGRCPAPKASALPIAPHLEKTILLTCNYSRFPRICQVLSQKNTKSRRVVFCGGDRQGQTDEGQPQGGGGQLCCFRLLRQVRQRRFPLNRKTSRSESQKMQVGAYFFRIMRSPSTKIST